MFRKNLRLSIFITIIMLYSSLASAMELKVALYPYVPRIDQFKTVISENWKLVQPDVKITWVEGWDGGYDNDPKEEYDLFVFDATYLTYFINQGWLMGLDKSEIEEIQDFLPFAINGMNKDGKYWAIPQLACTEYLIYQKEDEELNRASKVSEVVSALGINTYYDLKPPKEIGMMMDFSDDTTDANYYVKTLAEIKDEFPLTLPEEQSQIKKAVIDKLRNTRSTASLPNAEYSGESYKRGEWYGENHGRAYVGFSESLSKIDSDKLANIQMKVMPWSDNSEGIASPLFYCDVVGINPKTAERNTKELAIQLANLMASAPVIVGCFKSIDSEGPQYLTPVRQSVMTELANTYPAYKTIQNAVNSSGEPILFDLGKDSRIWLANMGARIHNMIVNE